MKKMLFALLPFALLVPLRAQTVDTAIGSINTEVPKLAGAVAAPEGSGADVHASRQSFLSAFGALVNAIDQSEDKQSVVVRLNPIPTPPFQVGVTGTFRKPSISSAVTNAIPEAQRATTTALLESKGLGDFDDLTVALSVSPATTTCTAAIAKRAFLHGCWGKGGTKQYRSVLSEALLPELKAEALGQPTHVTDKSGKALATLIDNQPQFSLTASYRDPGRLGGPIEKIVSAELQFGLANVNTFIKRKDADPNYVRDVLNDSFPKDAFTFKFDYTSHDHYDLATLPGVTVTDFTPVHLDSDGSWQLKAQWGRPLQFTANDRNVRFDVSTELHRESKNSIRTQNRAVAIATWTLPVGTNFDMPLSLSWANKPEFLADAQKHFTAHFALSYRLPWNLQ